MNLLHLRYFYEVARTGSFTESSHRLRISQPAISKLVRLLEEDLGTTLFERSRKKVLLTTDGELLFQSASRIFSEAEMVSTQLRSPDREFLGEWTLGASDNLAYHLVPPVLGRFKEKHAKLKVGLFSGTSTQIKSELLYDRCRMGLFFTPLKASEPFESKQIYETEFWIVLARENRWLKTARPKLSDLKKARVPRIESRHADYQRGSFPAHFHSHKLGMMEPAWLETNQHEVKKKLVLGGFGFSLLTKHTVEDDVREGRLIRVETPEKLRAPIYAVWRRGQGPGRVSEAFLSAWKRELGERA